MENFIFCACAVIRSKSKLLLIWSIRLIYFGVNRELTLPAVESATTQKIQFSIEDFISKCDQIRNFLRISFKFTEEILNRKLHFLCNMLLTLSNVHQIFFFSNLKKMQKTLQLKKSEKTFRKTREREEHSGVLLENPTKNASEAAIRGVL